MRHRPPGRDGCAVVWGSRSAEAAAHTFGRIEEVKESGCLQQADTTYKYSRKRSVFVGEQYLCATRSPTMPRPLRARHSRDAARARSHHRNRLRAAPQGRRRRSSSSLHVLRFLGAAPCICACNQIEWLLALSALWDGSAAGGGACSALVGLSIGPFAACFTWRARGAACDMLRLLPD